VWRQAVNSAAPIGPQRENGTETPVESWTL
jgi:hypothetical protein